jgi:phage regulator Rha-like protein
MSTDLVLISDDGAAQTDSLIIAEGTRNEHRTVLQLIRNNLADFEEFGGVAFEMRPFETTGGIQNQAVAILNEEHATLLMTYMRNTTVVKDFKKALVRAFYQLRRQAFEVRPLTGLEYARKLVAAEERVESERSARLEAEARSRELEAPASAWSHMAESSGDYEVADAAKVLSRDPNINIGRDRLFSFMAAEGWIFRNHSTSRWKAYQTQIDNGRLVEKLSKPFLHEPTGQMRVSDPTIRITPKGLAELHKRLGGSGQLAMVAAS